MEGKRRGTQDEESKKDDDPNNATNFPDDKSKKTGKVTPEGAVADEMDENMKTEEDSPGFIKRLGIEPYIRFADFCKYLSLFNQRTGLDEKIQCKLSSVFISLL